MVTDPVEPSMPRRAPRPGGMRWLRTSLDSVETVLYIVVATFLLIAGLLVVIGTIAELVTALRHGEGLLDVSLMLLEEALLLVIVGELLFTLRLVLTRGQLGAEPFLFIGIVAAVRRVVVVTAEVESLPSGGRALTNFLLELGLLAVLVLAFAASLYLLRRARSGGRHD